MATGTNIYYNDLVLTNVLVRDFAQTPIRDPSGTDQIYDQFIVRAECIVNAGLLVAANPRLGLLGVPGFNITAPSIMESVRNVLDVDRKRFKITSEGVILLEVNSCLAAHQGETKFDVNNGPKVLKVAITSISPETYRIQFEIELAAVLCKDRPPDILNNRWAIIDDVQEDFHTIRTWRGLMRLSYSATFTDPKLNPHSSQFRGIVVPALAKGWKRKSMNFYGEMNGLELGYSIVDEEMVGEAPPSPAITMRAYHRESMMESGSHNVATISIRLDGARTASKGLMMQQAIRIIIAKLELNKDKRGILKDLILTDHFSENENAVEVTANYLRTTIQDQRLGDIPLHKICKPIELAGYDPDVCLDYGPAGTAGVATAFATYLQTPCGTHDLPYDAVSGQTQSSNSGNYPATIKTYHNITTPNEIASPNLADEHKQSIYTFARLESILIQTENRVQLPVARYVGTTSTDDTDVVIRLAQGTVKRKLRYAAERVGSHPKMWFPEDFVDYNGIKHRILSWEPNWRAPQPSGDGRTTHSVDAEYIFALSRPPRQSEPLTVGSLPWDKNEADAVDYKVTQWFNMTGVGGFDK